MLLLSMKYLVIIWFSCHQIITQPLCGRHEIENVREFGQQTTVEEISFNEIIRELLNIIRSAKSSHFTILHENFISAENQLCLGAGVSLEIGTVKHLQRMGYSGKFLLSLQWINSQLMVFSNGSSNALFFNKPEIEDLISNYKIETIEVATNGKLILEGTKIKLWKNGDTLICQAGRLLLEGGKSFEDLIDDTFDQIRMIFDINSLLKNIISKELHRCCRNPKGWDKLGCVSKSWDKKTRECFLTWSQNLPRTKRGSDFLSYALGEGESISKISEQVSSALKTYNRNFQALAAHEHRVDQNLNTLSEIATNVSAYEQFHYESQIIQSILASGNIRRINAGMQMASDLAALSHILKKADIETLVTQISDGLLEITPTCRLKMGKCKILSYLSQGNKIDTVNLHQVLKSLVRSTNTVITCLITFSDGNWSMPSINLKHFNLKHEFLERDNTTFHMGELNNVTWLQSLLRPKNESEITLEEFSIYGQEEKGREKFVLICLVTTTFLLNGESVQCDQKEVLMLPEHDWTLENKNGRYEHFEYHHKIRHLNLSGSNWAELSNVLLVPNFDSPTTNLTDLTEEGSFVFINNNGELTNTSHF